MRLRWILEARAWSAREFSARAGLEPTHLSNLLRKADEDRLNIAMDTVVKLARAGGVSIEWLATGEGSTLPSVLDPSDPYPNRQRAARAAREIALSEEAIQSALQESVDDGASKTPRWWFDRMLAKNMLFAATVTSEGPTPEPGTIPSLSAVYPKGERRKSDRPPTTRRSHGHK